MNVMNVIKRNGTSEEVSFDKVLNRIKKLCFETPILSNVNYFDIAQKVCARIYNNVKTTELDELAAQICSSMILEHPEYGTLGARLIISNHQKNTSPSFSETVMMLYNNDGKTPVLSDDFYKIVMTNKEKLNNYIDYSRDYLLDYFGFKTLERAYLLKVNNKVIERPQHLFMRVAVGIHGNDIKDALETYDLMSKKYFTHATPTLFNAGTKHQQLSSCFLQSINGDSIEGIFDSIKESAMISKYSGGIGIHVHDVRAKGSLIRGTNGKSDGIVPMLKVFNQTGRYVNQCFTPETWVYSENGPKQMKDITTEDNLVTINGEFKKVNEIIINKIDKEILSIRATNTLFPIEVTKEHELYLIKNQKKTLNYSVIKNRLNKCIIKPDFYNADELNNDDLVGYPIPQYEEDNNIDDLDFYKFYGIMLGDGHLCKNRNEYGITLGDNKEDLKKFVRGYLTSRDINFWECNMSGCIGIRWSGNTKLELPRQWLYNKDDEKQIYSKFLHLPKSKILKILEGLLKSDGSNLKEIYFTNTSLQLIMQMRYLFLRLGILTSGYVKNKIGHSQEREITNKKIAYIIRIPKHCILKNILTFKKEGRHLKYFEWNNILWGRVKSIKHEHYKGDVYDFNMIDNHNYLTDMGLVHNSGKRAGSIAVYLEPHHADIIEFLQLKRPHGNEEERARDLFYALWIPDLFMKRVKENGKWSLMCPDECKKLSDVYSEKFEELYTQYEQQGRYRKQIDAQELWFKILECQIESGVPYLLYKDACNEKSNQKNLGTIKSSNLCCEVLEYSSPEETAVCNLASICLASFVERDENNKPYYNFDKLHEVTKVITKNLNKVIDINFYPVEKAKYSNLKHRPIGMGVQGLADTYVLMKYPFDSEEAKRLNEQIFETIYHAAVERSMELAEKMGPYETFAGSPASDGQLQFDLWGKEPSNRYDWTTLKEKVKQVGLRNSLMVAPMPTASTSQIMGFNECFEPFTSNLYKRKTMAGEFILVNKYLINDLIELNLWNKDLKDKIMLSDGSVQDIKEIPDDIKSLYKTVWEIKQKVLIDQAADRGKYICQSQSMNLFVEDPDFKKLTSMHFYSWSSGLKTGLYYLRSKPKAKQQKFTVDPNLQKFANVNKKEKDDSKDESKQEIVCTDEICLVCSS
jgi:ribonucleoside-diphosphate reductase alpha subunit